MSRRRFVILDRDGTLIVERNYLSSPDGVQLLPEVLTGLGLLQELGLGLVVITNQSGIGRGYFDMLRVEAIHARMNELLATGGVKLDGIYCCPHLPEDHCSCRKPSPGLLLRAALEHDFAPEECIVIGDKPCDITLGRAVGAITILVTTGYGASFAASGTTADAIVEDFGLAARFVRTRMSIPPPT